MIIGIHTFEFLYPGNDFIKIGATDAHPSNHWGTPGAIQALPLIAADYKNQYYPVGGITDAQKIAYNDMSLSYGGKFDLGKSWSSAGAHAEHREGINCDVRSNNIPTKRWARLNEIFRNRGSNRTNDETGTNAPHWHLRFEGSLTVNNPSVMEGGIEQNPDSFMEVNGVQRTPHAFLEEAFWGALDREPTQIEWETWHDGLLQAKLLGATPFLTKAIELETMLFNSPDYAARSRTDEQYVEDIFNSHLLRTPTVAERDYWLAVMANYPRTYNQVRRRQSMLEEFQALPEFAELVSGLVDSSTPTP